MYNMQNMIPLHITSILHIILHIRVMQIYLHIFHIILRYIAYIECWIVYTMQNMDLHYYYAYMHNMHIPVHLKIFAYYFKFTYFAYFAYSDVHTMQNMDPL
jgi:hypothetical protein